MSRFVNSSTEIGISRTEGCKYDAGSFGQFFAWRNFRTALRALLGASRRQRRPWQLGLLPLEYPAEREPVSRIAGGEVTLRNSIRKAAAEKFGSAGWLDSVLVNPEQQHLQAARERLQNQSKDTGPDNLMSELNFGSWVGLFHHRYEGILWPQMLRAVFPYMPRQLRTRRLIFQRLRRTRQLRNRVFHYEPIWYWDNLEGYHREMLDLIRWINPEMAGLVELADRFPSVYAQGPEVWRQALLRLGDSNLP